MAQAARVARRSSTPRCRCAGPARGWSSGARRSALTKRRSFADQPYWGRPVPGWGAARPRVLIVGLAPAANGANRTGRVFTGDRSGDCVVRGDAPGRPGELADQRRRRGRSGAQRHSGGGRRAVRAAGECADAGGARDLCAVAGRRVAAGRRRRAGDRRAGRVRAGGRRWTWSAPAVARCRRPQPKFGHARDRDRACRSGEVALIGCYHPSQQNTFTGRLTPAMLDDIFAPQAAARWRSA